MNRKDTKRKVGLVAAALLLISMLSYGTLAYFTDAEAATNVMTAGNVDIVLLDQTDVEGTLVDFNETFDGGKTGVMPGDVVSKGNYCRKCRLSAGVGPCKSRSGDYR